MASSNRDMKKKEFATSGLVISLILTVLFVLLLIFLPIPIRTKLQNKVDSDVVLK